MKKAIMVVAVALFALFATATVEAGVVRAVPKVVKFSAVHGAKAVKAVAKGVYKVAY